jgi:hypothetical protein
MKKNKSYKNKKQKGGAVFNPAHINPAHINPAHIIPNNSLHTINPLHANNHNTNTNNKDPVIVNNQDILNKFEEVKKKGNKELDSYVFWYFKMPMLIKAGYTFLVVGIIASFVIAICQMSILGINIIRRGLFSIIEPLTKLKGMLRPLRLKAKRPEDIPHILILIGRMFKQMFKDLINWLSKRK